MSTLTGKSALVTGSSSGIGRAIALALGREGAAVTVNYFQSKTKGEAQSVAEEIGRSGGRAQIVQADVSKQPDLDRLVDEAQRFDSGLDIVVAAAGGSVAFRPIKDTAPEDWDQVTLLNQRAVFFLLQKAAQVVREDGRVVVISSSMAADPYSGISGGICGTLATQRRGIRRKVFVVSAVPPPRRGGFRFGRCATHR